MVRLQLDVSVLRRQQLRQQMGMGAVVIKDAVLLLIKLLGKHAVTTGQRKHNKACAVGMITATTTNTINTIMIIVIKTIVMIKRKTTTTSTLILTLMAVAGAAVVMITSTRNTSIATTTTIMKGTSIPIPIHIPILPPNPAAVDILTIKKKIMQILKIYFSPPSRQTFLSLSLSSSLCFCTLYHYF